MEHKTQKPGNRRVYGKAPVKKRRVQQKRRTVQNGTTVPKWVIFVASLAIVISLATIIGVKIADVQLKANRKPGGARAVAMQPRADVYGPKAPEGMTYNFETENLKQVEILTPEPTDIPETAYVNEGGKYFHTEDCKYVKSTSVIYTVPYLLQNGFGPCTICSAQELANMTDE